MKKITISQFNELMNVPSIVENKEDKKELKFKLLDGIQEVLSDKWYNLKQNTQQALQYACMRSVEQGFFFCSPTHLSDKFGVSVATIYNIFKKLIEAKKVYKVNRTSTKHNGKGNAVYVFINHPNFPVINELLNINWKADLKADYKAENAENPCGSKDESDNSAPTYSLPTNLQSIKDNVKHYNVNQDDDVTKLLKDKIKDFKEKESEKPYEKPSVKWYKYVPKEINEKFGYYGSILTNLWRKIKLAERKVNIARLSEDNKMEVAMQVLENLKKHPRRKEMSLDEMCAYVYKGQLNGLFNLMGNHNLEGMVINKEYDYYAYLDCFGKYVSTTNVEKENGGFEDRSLSRWAWWIEEDEEQNLIEPERYFYGEEAPSLDNFPF